MRRVDDMSDPTLGRLRELAEIHPASEAAGTDEKVGRLPAMNLTVSKEQRRFKVPEIGALLAVLILLFAFFSLRSPYFFALGNMVSILEAIAITGMIAIPGTMLLIAGQFDLSVGSATAFTGVIMGSLLSGHETWVAVLAAITAGLFVGLVNGALVTIVGVNALITTLGTLAVLRGLSLVLADGQTISFSDFEFLGTARPLFGIPVAVLLFLVLMIVAGLIMRYTVFGRSLYAVGSNPVAARLTGVRSRRVLIIAFMASGLSAGIAGMILSSQLGGSNPNAAIGLELSVVTAIILGGASLHGGRGSITGTFVGLLVIAVLDNGLVLLGVSAFYQDVARGALLILAISFDQVRERFARRA
jgi:ribose transport system permease protein